MEYLVSASGLGDVLKHHKVRFIDLNHDEPVQVVNLGRATRLEYLFMAQTVKTADVLISMPKLVIRNGRVIDPESGLDAVRNIGIRGNRIAAISSAPSAPSGRSPTAASCSHRNQSVGTIAR